MSLLLCICQSEYSVMVGDSRMIEFDANGKQIRIVNENTRKVFKINDCVSIGYTGDPIPAQRAIQYIDSFNKNSLRIEDISEIIANSLLGSSINELGVKIAISGKDKKGKMNLYVLDTKGIYEYKKYTPTKGNPAFACCAHDKYKVAPIIGKYINEAIRFKSETETIKCLKECIEKVAEIDPSVNNITNEVVIK